MSEVTNIKKKTENAHLKPFININHNDFEFFKESSIYIIKLSEHWFIKNELILNKDKTQEMFFGLKIISNTLSTFKLYGFVSDPKLLWHDNIS